jgi:transcriptional regulator with XRE-family HTH domain
MDPVRLGLSVRALRHRRGWTQDFLACQAGYSRSVVWRIERGHAERVSGVVLAKVAAALGATIQTRILWHGEGLDRLLDAAHAELTEAMLELLRRSRWVVATEVSFNVERERGTIDILAFHERTGSLLVVEIKSVVPDLQSMLGTLDRKGRIAPLVAHGRGWVASSTSRVVVFPDDRTSRRRVERHRTTFEVALPGRTVAVRQWLRRPRGALAAILFLSYARQGGARHRIARPGGEASRGEMTGVPRDVRSSANP